MAVRPCSPSEGRWFGHWRTTWSTDCSSAPHSYVPEGAGRATSGGGLGHSSPKFSKYWIAILKFLQKLSRNEDEILYSDRFKEEKELNFSLYYWLIISLQKLS